MGGNYLSRASGHSFMPLFKIIVVTMAAISLYRVVEEERKCLTIRWCTSLRPVGKLMNFYYHEDYLTPTPVLDSNNHWHLNGMN